MFSFQEGQPYDDPDTSSRGRASTSDKQRTETFVNHRQHELGGAKHRRSARAHRSRERRKTRALNNLAAFERRYNVQDNSQDHGGAASG